MIRLRPTKQTTVTVQTPRKQKSKFNLQPIDGALNVLTQPSQAPDVSIIIPAYCEEDTIKEVLQRVIKISWSLGNTEIIVVDDGSTDGTAKKVKEFPFVKYIHHKRNQGKGAAIRTGIENARGNIVVIQDADLEYQPEYIPPLVKPIADGKSDIVYGSRFKGKREGMSVTHQLGNSVLSIVARILYNTQITDIMTGQKAFRRSILTECEIQENGFTVEIELTCKGFNGEKKFAEIPIPYEYRKYGVSKISYSDGFKSLIKLFAIYLRSEVP